MSDIIDIVVQETIDVVDITVNPNIIEVNVTRTSGGGGSQTLAQTLDNGNSTGGENILVNNADAIELENSSKLSQGIVDAGTGGNKGIALTCAVGFEWKFEAGEAYLTETTSEYIRLKQYARSLPSVNDDISTGFVNGSFWYLDSGIAYICTDSTNGAAVWEIYHNFIPTLQQVVNEGGQLTDLGIAFDSVVNPNLTAGINIDGLTFIDNDGIDEETTVYASNGIQRNLNANGTLLNFETPTNSDNVVLVPNGSGTLAFTSDIPTNTSDLTNDGADGVNPFITALDIPTTGQASTLVREVKNMTGATLTKGTVVYISGANGNKALVSKAIATTDALSARTFGLLQSNILNNGLGNCVIIGDLSGINTSAFAEGAQLYLSGVTAGAFTDTRVLAPTHLVYVGKVTRSHPTQGQIEVQIQNGYELAEIHDVQIVTPLNNQTILYETSSELWKNKTIIEDSIANGVTTVAPSQNAVFDALALKQNVLGYNPIKKIVSDTTSSSAVTGVTTETLCKTYTISANTFADGDFIKVLIGLEKTGVVGTATARIRVNQTNNFATATLVGTYTASAGSHTAILLKRDFLHFKSGVLKGISFNTNNQSDLAAGASIAYSTTTLSPTSEFYFYVSVINANAGDSTIVNQVQITN
jgi:hypothetical protein